MARLRRREEQLEKGEDKGQMEDAVEGEVSGGAEGGQGVKRPLEGEDLSATALEDLAVLAKIESFVKDECREGKISATLNVHIAKIYRALDEARHVTKAQGRSEKKAQEEKRPRINLNSQVMPISGYVLQSEKERIEHQRIKAAKCKENQEQKAARER